MQSPEQLAEQFQSIVNRAVEPILSGRETPIYHLSVLKAQQSLTVGNIMTNYMLFREKDNISGVQGLDFLPEHGLELIDRHHFFQMTVAQMMFGLREDNKFVRATMQGRSMGMGETIRELTSEESEALIDYAAAPHLNIGKLAVITQLTKIEEKVFRKAEEDARKRDEEFREADEELRRFTRRSGRF